MSKHNTLPDYNTSRELQPPKYRIDYFINNDKINVDTFVVDTHAYDSGEEATVKPYTTPHVSVDGNDVYLFVGWSYNNEGSMAHVQPLETLLIYQDTRLYAVWEKHSLLLVTVENGVGKLSLNRSVGPNQLDYLPYVNHFVIPEYYGGVRIKIISSDCFSDTSISSIVIPPSITSIEKDAFIRWSGNTLNFVEQTITPKYPGLTIQFDAFKGAPYLSQVVLPYRFIAIQPLIEGGTLIDGSALFDNTIAKDMHIYIRNPKDAMEESSTIPEEHLDNAISKPDQGGYVRNIYWGWND